MLVAEPLRKTVRAWTLAIRLRSGSLSELDCRIHLATSVGETTIYTYNYVYIYIYTQYIMGLQLFRITMVYVGVIMANHGGNYGNLLGTIPQQSYD